MLTKEALLSYEEWRAISGCKWLWVFKNRACMLSNLGESLFLFSSTLALNIRADVKLFYRFVASRLGLMPYLLVSRCVHSFPPHHSILLIICKFHIMYLNHTHFLVLPGPFPPSLWHPPPKKKRKERKSPIVSRAIQIALGVCILISCAVDASSS